MRAVVQRVKRAEVRVGTEVVGRVGPGLVVLLGMGSGDTQETARTMAEKIVNLRVFDDAAGRMNRSIVEAGLHAERRAPSGAEGAAPGILCVPQFTLYGDCRKGRRPSFDRAAAPEAARSLYEAFLESLRELVRHTALCVESGRFQAMMEVELVNDGPVTLLLDSEKAF
jgi:D-tyrosyl-tRNA(Tyr) deacylase